MTGGKAFITPLSRKRPVRFALACSIVAASLVAAGTARASGPVTVFPLPGSHYNTRLEQIVLRGIPPSAIGPVTVTGSVSGGHTGRLAADSDGQGASFIPDEPFTAGETVTVSTGLDITGGDNGTFSFSIGYGTGLVPYGKLALVSGGPGTLQHFRSRPDLEPPSLKVTMDKAPASDGDIFVAPQFGPAQDGPMILDPHGNLVWFDPYPVSENTLVTDFRVQNLYGQPVLTWWQGNTNAGQGRGEGVILNRNYEQIATVHAANGLDEDLHEFLITPQGDAFFTAAWPVRVPGISRGTIDSVVQEVDIKTGLVLFEWHSLDHIPLSASYIKVPKKGLYDPYHVNSISFDQAGNLLISMRNTSAVYDVDSQTGAVLWTLGGKDSSFKMGKGTSTWGQHDAIMQADGSITLFDDGAGPPTVHPYSRGVRERVDTTHQTATLVKSYSHSPAISANFEGSVQTLSNGDLFLGWGQQPYFSEYTGGGRQIFDARFTANTSSYRAYRFPWSGQPDTAPALASSPSSTGPIDLYASWNGATDVSRWRVLGGASPIALGPVQTATRGGFETRIAVNSDEPYFAVQALDAAGHTLATSSAVATAPHIAIGGSYVWVPRGGLGAVPVSCDTSHACMVELIASAGRTTIARTGKEYVPAGSSRLVYFQLTARGQSLLRSAHDRRLPVRMSASIGSGLTAAATLDLVPFFTSGTGPKRRLSPSSTLQILGATDYVLPTGAGTVPVRCGSPTGCRTRISLSVGKTVIARTGNEFIGAGEVAFAPFTLNATGRALLAQSTGSGNQLGARLTVAGAEGAATGTVALVQFR
jgi:hypothetical protein